MNTASYILVALIIALAAVAAVFIIRSARRGKCPGCPSSGCACAKKHAPGENGGHSCDTCPSRKDCPSQRKEPKDKTP